MQMHPQNCETSMQSESFIGTPFPAPKKSDGFGDSTKQNASREKEVRDEQGRRRFHGAFTGGFSAGYFNTVGSKEGWAPTEFVSSRDRRAANQAARPEDFMDEEDKQMISDASQLQATGDYDRIGSERRDLDRKRMAAQSMQSSGGILGVLPDSLIDDLVLPSSEPIGVKLLKRMGWRQGQGIGPRVSGRQRKPEDGPISDEEGLPSDITFAPQDSTIVRFTHKSNRNGLGFDPYKNAREFDKSQRTQLESKYLLSKGKKDSSYSMGMDDDDDDDVYGNPALTDLDMDFELRPEEPQLSDPRKTSNKSMPLTPSFCSDGRPPIAGFVMASKKEATEKWFPPPKVPKSFIPRHIFAKETAANRLPSGQNAPKLTADDRRIALGEEQIKAPSRSVFDFMSKESKNHLDQALGFVMDVSGDAKLHQDAFKVPTIDRQLAAEALKGFIPFGENAAKQARYKQFLEVQAGLSTESIVLPPGFTGESMSMELNEFVQAARIYKPLSVTMANRFTSASSVIEFAQPAAGLRTAEDIRASAGQGINPPVVERMVEDKSQAAKAAAMGMFGPLTRTTADFFPVKLLCKRFNVPDPHPGHKHGLGDTPTKEILDQKTMDKLMFSSSMDSGAATLRAAELDSVATQSNQDMEVDESMAKNEQQQPTLQDEETERPPMDIFKAIFDDSDSESESEHVAIKPQPKSTTSKAPTLTGLVSGADAHQPSLPFRPKFVKKAERGSGDMPSGSKTVHAKKSVKVASEEDDDEEMTFGPKIQVPTPRKPTKEKARFTSQVPDNAPELASSKTNISPPSKGDAAPLKTSSLSASVEKRPRSRSPSRQQKAHRSEKDSSSSSRRREHERSRERKSSRSRDRSSEQPRRESDRGHRQSKSSKHSSDDRDGREHRHRESDRSKHSSSSGRHRHSSQDRDDRHHHSSSRSRHSKDSKSRARSGGSAAQDASGEDEGDEEDMWVEKTPPRLAATETVPLPPILPTTSMEAPLAAHEATMATQRKRRTASDFF